MFYPHTKTFGEIMPNAEALRRARTEWITLCPAIIGDKAYITDAQLNIVWAVLGAKYGESHINFDNETTFRAKLISRIGETAPKFFKDLAIQQKLASLDIEDSADMALISSAKIFVANHADHPATDPSMDDFAALGYIDAQNTSTSKRGVLESLATLSLLMRSDLYTEFTKLFRSLFIAIAYPEWECEDDPESSDVQDVKELVITHNGEAVIGPDLGYDSMRQVVANVQVPGGGASVQATKTVTITENGNIVSLPDEGYDAVAATQISVNVPMPAVEQTKEVEITANGDYASTPSAGYNGVVNTLIHVEVPQTTRIQFGKSVTFTSNGTRTVTPDSGYDALAGVSVTTNVTNRLQNPGAIVPSTSEQTFNFDTAHYDGYDNFVVKAVGRSIDPNIKATNIKSGVTILGVTGTYEGEGGGGPEMLDWFEEFDWTPTANVSAAHTFEFDDHGEAPNFIYIYTDKKAPTTNRELGGVMLFNMPTNYTWASTTWTGAIIYRMTGAQWAKISPTSTTGATNITNTSIEITPNTYSGTICFWMGGNTYHVLIGKFANAEV